MGRYDRAIRANEVRMFDPEREGWLSAASARNRLSPSESGPIPDPIVPHIAP